MLTDATPAEDALAIIAYDWLVSRSWNRLHFADLSPEDAADLIDEGGLRGPVRLSCGRTAAWAGVPGVLTRMGAQRCGGCCRATGLTPGKGSPKNDPACRILLGLGSDRTPAPRASLRESPDVDPVPAQ